jgi:hypothetical protein
MMMKRMDTRKLLVPAALLAMFTLTACEEDDPEPNKMDMSQMADQGGMDMVVDQAEPADLGPDQAEPADMDMGVEPDLAPDMEPDMEQPMMCERPATDYIPGSATDGWDACVSDNNMYTQFGMTISSAARVAAFEQMALLLWDNPTTPTGDNFTTAREAYSADNGLDSRVGRREDEHYPPVMKNGAVVACNTLDMTEIMANPERCVGPALMQPLIIDAFQKGQTGVKPVLQAARLEAGLLWFLYLSTHKEAITCTNTKADCDSAFAYYTGGEQRSGGLGLARLLKAADPEAHDYVFDGILAYRCWRDLDNADVAVDTDLRDRGVNQMDRGLLRGVASLVADRAALLKTSQGEQLEADWAYVQILGGSLVREAKAREDVKGGQLAVLLAKAAPAAGDGDAVIALLEEIFPCP